MTAKDFIYMKNIELDLLKVRAGIFEETPKKDFYIKRTTGYITPELRYSPDQARGPDGKWVPDGSGGSNSSGSGSSSSENNNVDSSGKIGYTKRIEAAQDMSDYEKAVVSSHIMTDYSNPQPDGQRHITYYGGSKYVYYIKGSGQYEFKEKSPIKGIKREGD